jgi:hypothetical protein
MKGLPLAANGKRLAEVAEVYVPAVWLTRLRSLLFYS